VAEDSFSGTLRLGGAATLSRALASTRQPATSSDSSLGPQVAIRARLNAFILDLLLLGVATRLLAGGLGHSVSASTELLLLAALQFAYFFTLEARTGQTIGKRVFHVRVATLAGGRATTKQIAVRTVLRVFDALPLLYASGLISLMRTGSARRQRIGDVAAGTTVILDSRGKPLATPRWLLPLVTLAATAISIAVILPILKHRHVSVPPAAGFTGNVSEPPADGQWRAVGTTTSSSGYSNDYAGRQTLRSWVISRDCAGGRCSFSLTVELPREAPATAALVPRSDGWHAVFPVRIFPCGYTSAGGTIYWPQHTTAVLRFTGSGRVAEANMRYFSQTPACGYGTALTVWYANLVAAAGRP
jgi:uncharacterized RDD family membrane protein YckC